MKKEQKVKNSQVICRGNQTIPYHRDYKIYGAYNMQAITQAEGTCENGVPFIPLNKVIEAKNFVDDNHK